MLEFSSYTTFAQVEKIKAQKWKTSSDKYQKQIVEEELQIKYSQLKRLKDERKQLYAELKQQCSIIRYIAAIRVLTSLRKKR